MFRLRNPRWRQTIPDPCNANGSGAGNQTIVEEEQLRIGFVNMHHDDEDKDWVQQQQSEDRAPSHTHQYDAPN